MPATDESDPSPPEAPRLECAQCHAVFQSRNKLFAHLKASSCSPLPPEHKTEKLAFLFGYDGAVSMQPEAIQALLCALDIVREVSQHSERVSFGDAGRAPGMTCCSSYEQRTAELFKQDDGASALSDLLCVTCETLEVLGLNTIQIVERLNGSLPESVRVFSCMPVPLEFHAENACLRRCYEYTLPMSALFVPDRDYKPDLSPSKLKKHNAQNGILHNDSELISISAEVRLGFFQQLKSVMRRFHSVKCWHNFTYSAVATDAPVEREVGKFHHARTVEEDNNWDNWSTHSIDSFLTYMLRKMVSVVIAAMQAAVLQDDLLFGCKWLWIPGILPTIPVAPLTPGSAHLTLVEILFKKNFNPLVASMKGQKFHEAKDEFQKRLVRGLKPSEDLVSVYAQFIEHDLRPWSQAVNHKPVIELNRSRLTTIPPAPDVFVKVLQLLREADSSGTWPTTSDARARLIAASENSERASDSFSLGLMPPPLSQPKTNFVFPELMEAAFQLEVALSPARESSSTIAVNRNAVFLPHTDCGAGAGQGISQIVALGDFIGGEIAVEGEVHDIRYTPLEFNGWTQRHWTLPFEGERFSLVFFTPLGCETTGLQYCQQLREEGILK